jgi:hypothetical protein
LDSGWASNLLSINPYDPVSFRSGFTGDPIYHLIPDNMIKVWSRSGSYDPDHHAGTTPRWRHMHGYFCMASFYYLKFIMDASPGTVADIGCGENVFKMFYPQIIGYDPFIPAADHMAHFDREFVDCNRRGFDSAFACNSTHFSGLDGFLLSLEMLASIVRPGGLVHATANTARFMDTTHGHQDSDRDRDRDRCVDMALMADEAIRSSRFDWVVVDQCYDGIYPGELEFSNGILGNIRLVFRV